MSDLQARVDAVKATQAHFAGRPFAWGRVDCVKVAAWHLRAMGHHLGLGLNKAGTYRSALGARRALERAGHASLAAALDGVLPRIAPAAALPGDLLIGPGTDEWEALGIYAGNGAVVGFYDGEKGLTIVRLNSGIAGRAWRA